MTDVKEMIEVMQAFAEGKKIECTSRFGEPKWHTVHNPHWDWGTSNYRVAEEQDGVVYVVVGNSEDGGKLYRTLIHTTYHPNNPPAVFAKHSEAVKFKDDMTESFPGTTYTVLTVKVIK